MLKPVVIQASTKGGRSITMLVPYCDNCSAELPSAYERVCKRCGFPRPSVTVDEQGNHIEQYTDVALAQDIGMVLDDLALDIRVARGSFNPQIAGKENPEVVAIREFLEQAGIRYAESGSAVATFRISRQGYRMATWVDSISHGCCIGNPDRQGREFEIAVTRQRLETRVFAVKDGIPRKILRFLRGPFSSEN